MGTKPTQASDSPLSGSVVEPLEDGVWLPDPGIAINTYRAGSPVFVTCPSVLRKLGRRSGVLATQATWSTAFPTSRVPRAPAPDDKELRLGLLRVAFVPDEEARGVVHLRVHTPETLFCALSVVHCAGGALPLQSSFSPGEINLVGPWSASCPCDSLLAKSLRKWAGSSEVYLYGAWCQTLLGTPDWLEKYDLHIARQPVQDLLF